MQVWSHCTPEPGRVVREGGHIMRRRALGLCAAALLAVSAAAPASAAPPGQNDVPFFFLAPDTNLGLVVFINMDRATYCTPEIVAWEEAFIDWLEGGEVGDPPEFPGAPDGFDPVRIQETETGQGALVQLLRGSNLTIELWEMDPDAPLIGPCTDTDDTLNRIATGTATLMNNDNDLFGSGTRGNAFGNQGLAFLEGEDGTLYKYSFRFHVNSACHTTADGEPACVIDSSTLQIR